MSRAPSAETQLRTEKRERKRLCTRVVELENALAKYRARATMAEQDVAAWKKRFDLLLAREPSGWPPSPHPPLLMEGFGIGCSICGSPKGHGALPCPKMAATASAGAPQS